MTLTGMLGLWACMALAGLIGWMLFDAYKVLKYGLEEDDEFNEDED